ncbi:MAG: hypothetical protein KZQ63_05180 [Candidatus Thiodiazotropha sp. (ex Lucinoma aequizonata)]|nr:hypothetical protein [Candidatus Thiodiazotropha sp. (ex Lucinoma aequizonata)]MCU7909078.1 hypothetical protein [Candidatus Thiodiazotropha sp. (ex Lucinoma aequizonata)]MCU7911530.1 hypothetical protein [Candidatus Thiodiazotropha sp. (ex Lucinoma aequizonata)]
MVSGARQKTHFFREPVLPRLVISGLIINTGAIFSCRRIKNDNNFVIIQLKNWKKCLTRFFCIFSDFKEDYLPASITIHTSSKRLAMGFFYTSVSSIS